MLGDVALRVGLDEEVEVSRLVVAGDGGVRADDFLGAAVGLGKGGADGDVLADGESENAVARGKLEPVAANKLAKRRQRHSVAGGGATYMATLWEMTVFSWSSNSWKTSGLRTFLMPIRCHQPLTLDAARGYSRILFKFHAAKAMESRAA